MASEADAKLRPPGEGAESVPLTLRECDGYLRLDVEGVLATGMALVARPEDVALVIRSERFLVDLSRVTEITADAFTLIGARREGSPATVRIAVLAPTPLAFGWTRQVILGADLNPERVAAFRDEAAALAWLVPAPNADAAEH